MILFLRSRRATVVVLTAILIGAGASVLAAAIVTPTPDSQIRIPVGLLLPLVPAVAIGATSSSAALSVQEARARRRLWLWQITWLATVTALSTIILTFTAQTLLSAGYTSAAVARNTIGLIGLSLAGASILGPALSWIAPLAALVIPGYVFNNLFEDPAGVLTFFAQPASNTGSGITAIALLVTGLGLQILAPNPKAIGGLVRQMSVTQRRQR